MYTTSTPTFPASNLGKFSNVNVQLFNSLRVATLYSLPFASNLIVILVGRFLFLSLLSAQIFVTVIFPVSLCGQGGLSPLQGWGRRSHGRYP